jgi:acetyl-CoA carboxylase biotin carboxylase subunit
LFKKVLIANRGEIAVRLLRACRELGLETVAVYSEADRNALHVRYADEAYPIGPAPARESYLCMERIIDVAKAAKAEAIHPGYGFLAENPEFARACQAAGLAFVGPNPEALELLGNKIAARRLMAHSGVPVIAGSGEESGDEDLTATAQRLGFPLLIKAAAGGGGKGMRAVRSLEELPDSLAVASREAASSFGDGTVYLERLIEDVRHIEFQILADHHGNVIHLGERECSIQRRFQKLMEEAPSAALDEELRERMGWAAVEVARACNYTNAGTVEFLLDKDRNFYFLEVNTRLQVEHPVTEMVSGVDIVKEQLRIASGRKMRYGQEDITPHGWAMECRILAEDPDNGFAPSVGRVTTVFEPSGPGVRVDSGIYHGFEVSLYYDSLISKLITWGDTRPEAVQRMRRALDEYRIVGIKTTIPFYQRLLDSFLFMSGRLDTDFMEKAFIPTDEAEPLHLQAAAIAATLLHHRRSQRPGQAAARSDGEGRSNWKRAGRWRSVQSWNT